MKNQGTWAEIQNCGKEGLEFSLKFKRLWEVSKVQLGGIFTD